MSQEMEALANANRIRLARAALKREIAAGRTSVAEVMHSETPDWLERMAVGELVRATRRMGPSKSTPLLRRVPVSESQQVGRLTERQRRVLAALMVDWSARNLPRREVAA